MSRKTVAKICYLLGWIIIGFMIISGIIGFIAACVIGAKTGIGGRGFLIGFLLLLYSVLMGVMASLGYFALSGVVDALDDQLNIQQGMYRTLTDIKNNLNTNIVIDPTKIAPVPANEPKAEDIPQVTNETSAEAPKDEIVDNQIAEPVDAPQAESTDIQSPQPLDTPQADNTDIQSPQPLDTPQAESTDIQSPQPLDTPQAETTETSAANVIEPFKEDSIEALMNTPNEAAEMDTTILTSELKAPDYIPNETYETDKSWVCAMCGRENTMGSFCIACGSKKIERM